MALHIADPEVTRLTAELAKLGNTTKTEALRQVLREAVKAKQIAAKREGLREFITDTIAEARRRHLTPVTKEEMDDLWGMDELDGN